MDDNEMRKLKRRLPSETVERIAEGHVEDDGDMRIFRYGRHGEFDAELYHRLQTEANKLKIENQWVPEEHIAILSRYIRDAGATVRRGICHGTRRGNEQVWFREHLGGAPDVFGTEISDTATQFPHTIQWDFHEVDPSWVGAIDLVYSNSWDHSHDPERAFRGWASCLSPGGFLLLDHGWNYEPGRVSAMDPFGITEAGLVRMLDRTCAEFGRVTEVIDGGQHKHLPIRTIVFRARD